MDKAEEIAIKTACIRAAAVLIGAQSRNPAHGTNPPNPDPATCARYAKVMFERLTGESWEVADAAAPLTARGRSASLSKGSAPMKV
jgi:hypothetical protein